MRRRRRNRARRRRRDRRGRRGRTPRGVFFASRRDEARGNARKRRRGGPRRETTGVRGNVRAWRSRRSSRWGPGRCSDAADAKPPPRRDTRDAARTRTRTRTRKQTKTHPKSPWRPPRARRVTRTPPVSGAARWRRTGARTNASSAEAWVRSPGFVGGDVNGFEAGDGGGEGKGADGGGEGRWEDGAPRARLAVAAADARKDVDARVPALDAVAAAALDRRRRGPEGAHRWERWYGDGPGPAPGLARGRRAREDPSAAPGRDEKNDAAARLPPAAAAFAPTPESDARLAARFAAMVEGRPVERAEEGDDGGDSDDDTGASSSSVVAASRSLGSYDSADENDATRPGGAGGVRRARDENPEACGAREATATSPGGGDLLGTSVDSNGRAGNRRRRKPPSARPNRATFAFPRRLADESAWRSAAEEAYERTVALVRCVADDEPDPDLGGLASSPSAPRSTRAGRRSGDERRRGRRRLGGGRRRRGGAPRRRARRFCVNPRRTFARRTPRGALSRSSGASTRSRRTFGSSARGFASRLVPPARRRASRRRPRRRRRRRR